MTDHSSAEQQLSRVVPQHTHRVKFRWVKADFLVYDAAYRAVRAKMRKPLDTCRWCKRKFEDGEQMGLAQPEKGPNWLLCQSCIKQMEAL